MTDNNALLDIASLKKYFPIRQGFMGARKAWVRAVDDVNITVNKGETLGIVGESGCGKSTLARTITGLYEPTAGTIRMRGQDLFTGPTGKKLAHREIQMVFQDPYSSLNPRMTIRSIIAEPLTTHTSLRGRELDERIVDLMETVALSGAFLHRYPHQFSGGQRQRIGIARALALNPDLVILDEPTSSLDVSVQAQILNLLVDLQQKFDLTYIFVTHHLGVVRHMSDRIAVMYLGQIVEIAPAADLFDNPLHPYTKGLLASEPFPDPDAQFEYAIIEGEVPSAIHIPTGCRFHTRCPEVISECPFREPVLREITPGHWVRCVLPQRGVSSR